MDCDCLESARTRDPAKMPETPQRPTLQLPPTVRALGIAHSDWTRMFWARRAVQIYESQEQNSQSEVRTPSPTTDLMAPRRRVVSGGLAAFGRSSQNDPPRPGI